MKKLLFVYDNMCTGGTTTALLSLLNKLDYNRFSVDLLLFRNEGPFLNQIPEQVNLLKPAYRPILSPRIPMKYWKMLVFALNGGFFRALCSYFRHRGTPKGIFRNILMHQAVRAQVALSSKVETNYDAAVGFIEGWSDHYVLSGKVKAEKKIAWIHPDYADSYLLPEVDCKVLAKADYIVVVSDACKATMQRSFPELSHRVCAIENIISAEYIKTRSMEQEIVLPGKYLNLGTVCRCDMQVKGLDRILESLGRLKEMGLLREVKWHLVGDGKDMNRVKEMVSAKGLEDHVVLWGHSDNPLPILRKMDAFLLASRYEGKPVAVSEALCLGVPCIVTNYVSAHEQVKHGRNGLVTDNSADGVLDALKQILTDRTVLATLKQGAKDEKYDNLDALEKIYAILGENNGI